MTATPPSCATATPQINWAVFDRRCKELGIETEAAKAELLHVERTMLWRYRRGEFAPKFGSVIGAAKALELTVEELVAP